MSGLKLKEHVIDMRWGPRFHGVVMIRGMDSKYDAYEELISGVGMEM